MNKHSVRFVAAIIIPCLLNTPGFSISFTTPSCSFITASTQSARFAENALIPGLVIAFKTFMQRAVTERQQASRLSRSQARQPSLFRFGRFRITIQWKQKTIQRPQLIPVFAFAGLDSSDASEPLVSVNVPSHIGFTVEPSNSSGANGASVLNVPKYIYSFGNGKSDGDKTMNELLGGKGKGVADMTLKGIPVPPGFTITTTVGRYFLDNMGKMPEGLDAQLTEALAKLEKTAGKEFGNPANPLLVSVRSGAADSMPGMMETILNVGLNDQVVEGLARLSNNPRYAWDSYRRLMQMYGDTVEGIPLSKFETVLEAKKHQRGVELDKDLSAEDLKEIVAQYQAIFAEAGKTFPQDPLVQLTGARDAVFESWNLKKAADYRRTQGIPENKSTAVTVMEMVFGNLGDTSGTGVCFTRDPSTGKKGFYGEYLFNAQGEDVVAGIRTPQPIAELEREMPDVYRQLHDYAMFLESDNNDMQDIEFTIEKGKLFILQNRTGKRAAGAAIKIAVDMLNEGRISTNQGIRRVTPEQIDAVLHSVIDPTQKLKAVAKGLNASPGAAVGQIVFDADTAERLSRKGQKVLLVRDETTPEDIHGMIAAQGILTARGGKTSHAAVVARGLDKPCVAGASGLRIDPIAKTLQIGSLVLKEGDWVAIDGTVGLVYAGQAKVIPPEITPEFDVVLGWAQKKSRMSVRANADIPRDAKVARRFGARGIGLTRTEHMFFDAKRLPYMREMIMAQDVESRKRALAKLFEFQAEDFFGLFQEMDGFPVTIRLLDPPLHEFLPSSRKVANKLSREIGVPVDEILRVAKSLHEINPMLGHRGARLGITYPEISEMQAAAIATGAARATKQGIRAIPEIMVPLIGYLKEFEHQEEVTRRIVAEVMQREGVHFDYTVGTMIEVPRAAQTADEIATKAEFFSFGTNDLTQMTLGLSRDDSPKIIMDYRNKEILPDDPFETVDQVGVGGLMKTAIEKGRSVNPSLKIGVCGEHGGDPRSVKFFHQIGLDYVSASPYRVPVAWMAAAHATLDDEEAAAKSKEQGSSLAGVAAKAMVLAIGLTSLPTLATKAWGLTLNGFDAAGAAAFLFSALTVVATVAAILLPPWKRLFQRSREVVVGNIYTLTAA